MQCIKVFLLLSWISCWMDSRGLWRLCHVVIIGIRCIKHIDINYKCMFQSLGDMVGVLLYFVAVWRVLVIIPSPSIQRLPHYQSSYSENYELVYDTNILRTSNSQNKTKPNKAMCYHACPCAEPLFFFFFFWGGGGWVGGEGVSKCLYWTCATQS